MQRDGARDGKTLGAAEGSVLTRMIGSLDRYLRLRQGVVEYSSLDNCIFRLQLIESPNDVVLSDGTEVHVGDRLVDLHIWNEHVPLVGGEGPTVGFARYVSHCVDVSLCELARYLETRDDLSDICAIRGNLVLGSRRRGDQIARIAGRYGFERVRSSPMRSSGERLHRFGENILITMLVFARNPSTLRTDTLVRDRTLTYLSRRALSRRYGVELRQGQAGELASGPPDPNARRI